MGNRNIHVYILIVLVLLVFAVIGFNILQGNSFTRNNNPFETKTAKQNRQSKGREEIGFNQQKIAERAQRLEQLAVLKMTANNYRRASEDSRHNQQDNIFSPSIHPQEIQKAIWAVDRHLAEEPHDTEWEKSIVDAAAYLFNDTRFNGTEFHSVRCSTAMCNMILRFSDTEALRRFREVEDLPGPWSEGEAFGTATMVDGHLALKLSFSKKGLHLPVPIGVLEPTKQDKFAPRKTD